MCTIPKVGSTDLRLMLTRLANLTHIPVAGDNYAMNAPVGSHNVHKTWKGHLPHLHELGPRGVYHAMRNASLARVALVRHPVELLISAYKNKVASAARTRHNARYMPGISFGAWVKKVVAEERFSCRVPKYLLLHDSDIAARNTDEMLSAAMSSKQTSNEPPRRHPLHSAATTTVSNTDFFIDAGDNPKRHAPVMDDHWDLQACFCGLIALPKQWRVFHFNQAPTMVQWLVERGIVPPAIVDTGYGTKQDRALFDYRNRDIMGSRGGSHTEVGRLFTPELLQLVKKFWSPDIRLFGFDPDRFDSIVAASSSRQ